MHLYLHMLMYKPLQDARQGVRQLGVAAVELCRVALGAHLSEPVCSSNFAVPPSFTCFLGCPSLIHMLSGVRTRTSMMLRMPPPQPTSAAAPLLFTSRCFSLVYILLECAQGIQHRILRTMPPRLTSATSRWVRRPAQASCG